MQDRIARPKRAIGELSICNMTVRDDLYRKKEKNVYIIYMRKDMNIEEEYR